MPEATSLRRALILTTALAALAAPTASGRVGEAPLRGGLVSALPAAGNAPGHVIPARVDGMGVQPGGRTGLVAAPVDQPSPRDGSDWPSAALAVAAVLSLALLGLAGRSALTAARAALRRA